MTPVRPTTGRFGAPRARSGGALIVTLWIALTVAGTAVLLARTVRVDALMTANEVAAIQAEAVAQGALQYVLSRLDGRKGLPPVESETPCECVRVGDGAFWILRPPRQDESGHAFGIVDEAGKINLNAATLDMLNQLPGITGDVAAAIVDWRDSDNEATADGAESEAYLLLDSPYACKDAPFETVEELFLVRGVTRALMFGRDLNRNGVMDPEEAERAAEGVTTAGAGETERGIAHWVTVYSAEPNTDANDQARVDVNGSPELINVLQQGLEAGRVPTVAAQVRRARPFRNLVDFYLRSGLTAAEFAQVEDRLTTRRETTTRGLVNVATAPREVLRCLPDLDDSDAAALVSKRADLTTNAASLAWIAEALPPEKAVSVGDVATTRSFQYSADILAVSGDGRAFKRYRAVIDTRASPPNVVYWKDLTALGWPLSEELRKSLRQGYLKQEGTP